MSRMIGIRCYPVTPYDRLSAGGLDVFGSRSIVRFHWGPTVLGYPKKGRFGWGVQIYFFDRQIVLLHSSASGCLLTNIERSRLHRLRRWGCSGDQRLAPGCRKAWRNAFPISVPLRESRSQGRFDRLKFSTISRPFFGLS